MRMKYKYFVLALACLSIGQVNGQLEGAYTLDQAIQSALNNNFQIEILENNKHMAENNVHVGNAGLLPSVSAKGSYSYSLTSSQQVFAGGFPPVDVDNAGATNVAASANLNYTLFNGLSGWNNFQKLKVNKSAVDAQSKAAIEAVVIQVSETFLSLLRAQDQVTISQQNLAISQKRYKRAEVSYSLGGNVRTELLNAKVSLTADSSQLIQAEMAEETYRTLLTRLVGSQLPSSKLEESELEIRTWTRDELLEEAKTNNAVYTAALLQSELAQADLKISTASYAPSLSLSAGYGYNQSLNDVGILLENTSIGPNGALSLSIPIFSGMRNNIQRQNLKIALENAQLSEQDTWIGLQADIENALLAYNQNLKLHLLESNNQEAAEANLERSEELFKAGQITNTQFREAQLNLALTGDRISASKVNVLRSELTILRLIGALLS
jgi:outer membrane protein